MLLCDYFLWWKYEHLYILQHRIFDRIYYFLTHWYNLLWLMLWHTMLSFELAETTKMKNRPIWVRTSLKSFIWCLWWRKTMCALFSIFPFSIPLGRVIMVFVAVSASSIFPKENLVPRGDDFSVNLSLSGFAQEWHPYDDQFKHNIDKVDVVSWSDWESWRLCWNVGMSLPFISIPKIDDLSSEIK